MQEDHDQSIEQLREDYPNKDFEQGLTNSEAQRRLAENGPNKLENKKFQSGGCLSDNFTI